MSRSGEGGFPRLLTFQPAMLTAQPPTTASVVNLPGFPHAGKPSKLFLGNAM